MVEFGLGAQFVRRLTHRIATQGGLWEGDYVSKRLDLQHDGKQSVQTDRNHTVRWAAAFRCLEKVVNLAYVRIKQLLEHEPLHIRNSIVNTYRTAI